MPALPTPSTKPTLMLFSSEWCNTCKRVKPVIEDIGKSYDQQVNIVTVDIVKSPEVATKYEVLSVPTIIILKDDKITERLNGLVAKDTLLRKLGIS